MAWAVPQYTRAQVNRAGEILVAAPEVPASVYEDALGVINNWRSSHSFPLNTLQVGLREYAYQVDPESLVAQRIKRLSSIEQKLRRFRTMELAQMQDIGGCRAVVRNVARVRALVDLYKKSRIKHKPDHIDDYISNPQRSGYRGVHLIYRYFSDRNDTYNGLKIEVQLRSPLQHAWATAVETVGTFIKQALKASQGEEAWLRFFSLMGSAIAERERTAPVEGTPRKKIELVRELRRRERELAVEARLNAYGAALQTLEDPSVRGAHYFLLHLDALSQQVTVTGYKARELDRASKEYLALEREVAERPGAEAVLVKVESLAALRRAYPNYFLDTKVFIDTVNRALAV